MDIREQEYFIAIAEECNLTKAAQKLYVSQPSLSQFLSKLEDSIGVRLFNRRINNSLSLTDAGELYYKSAKEIFQIRSDFMRKLTDLKFKSSIKLAFGINAEKGVNIMSQIISELSNQYPSLRIEIRQYKAFELQQLVINGELDLAYSAFAEKNPNLGYIEFPPYEIVLVLPATHSLAHLGTTNPTTSLSRLPLNRFKKENFVMLKNYTVLRNIEDNYCKKIGFEPNIKIETHSIASAFSVLENSSYITLCPYSLIHSKKSAFTFVGLNPPLYYNTGFYYNKNIYQSEIMKSSLKVAKKLVDI